MFFLVAPVCFSLCVYFSLLGDILFNFGFRVFWLVDIGGFSGFEKLLFRVVLLGVCDFGFWLLWFVCALAICGGFGFWFCGFAVRLDLIRWFISDWFAWMISVVLSFRVDFIWILLLVVWVVYARILLRFVVLVSFSGLVLSISRIFLNLV